MYSGGLFFMFIIFAGLTVGSVFFAYSVFVFQQFHAFPFAFAVWVFWLYWFIQIDHTLFGKTEFFLNKDGLNTMHTALTLKYKKRFDLTKICHFAKEVHHHQKHPIFYSLRVVCQDDNVIKSFRLHPSNSNSFNLPLNEGLAEELDNLCEQLNAFLEKLKAGNVA